MDLKPRDTSIPATQQGVFEKYRVQRVDGKDDTGASYFVLDVTNDEHAIPALRAYAKSCQEDYPQLAEYLRSVVVDSTPADQMSVFGVKSNGESVLVGTTIASPTIKAKEMIRVILGYGDFDDDDSDHAMMLYVMENYRKWLIKYHND